MKNYTKLNQTGASALAFTTVFILVLSLLSIGYATLARRDQRATLDKTLSAEAQVATESGVNSVTKYIETVGLVNAVSSSANPAAECYNPNPGIANYSLPSFGTDGPKITCIKWDMTPTSINLTLKPFEPYSFGFKTLTGTGVVKLEWTSTDSPSDATSLYDRQAGNKLPAIKEKAFPIIRLVIANTTNIYDPLWKPQIIYLVPSSNTPSQPHTVTPGQPCGDMSAYTDYVDLGNCGVGTSSSNISLADGLVYYVPCDFSKQYCSARIGGYHYDTGLAANGINLSYNITSIGGTNSDVIFQSANSMDGFATGAVNKMAGIQAKVDVNVQAQDQSKRTIASIPLQKQTWQPWFATLAESLCKDIKVDGENTRGKIDPDACPKN